MKMSLLDQSMQGWRSSSRWWVSSESAHTQARFPTYQGQQPFRRFHLSPTWRLAMIWSKAIPRTATGTRRHVCVPVYSVSLVLISARLIPKADRKKIHEYLFKGIFTFKSSNVSCWLFRRGRTCCKEGFQSPKAWRHWHQKPLREWYTRSLGQALTGKKVIKACQSLTSRGFLKTQFSWQWYYYTLTPEGLDYLREWLHLPSEIVPATHVKQQRSHAPPRGMIGGDDREKRPGGRGGHRGDREGGYRRRDAGDGKDSGSGAPGSFAPEFRGGFGRGRGAPPPSWNGRHSGLDA